MKGHVGTAVVLWAAWHGMLGQAVPDEERGRTNVIVSVGEIPTITVRPGTSSSVVMPIVIADGYHVQANPASDEFLIPLELELQLEQTDTLVSLKVSYPKPGTFRLEGTTEDLLTYHGSIGIEVSIRALAQAREGKRLFKGTLSYQACDSKRCLFPDSVPVSFVAVVSSGESGN